MSIMKQHYLQQIMQIALFTFINELFITLYELFITRDQVFKRCDKCYGGQTSSCPRQMHSTCTIPDALNMTHPYGYMEIKVNASNPVGRIETISRKLDLFFHGMFYIFHMTLQLSKYRDIFWAAVARIPEFQYTVKMTPNTSKPPSRFTVHNFLLCLLICFYYSFLLSKLISSRDDPK
jgi:hypothetical protein